jgi:hypothetical protein
MLFDQNQPARKGRPRFRIGQKQREADSGPAHLLGLCLLPFMFPDAHFVRLGHEEEAQDQAHRRNRDRVDQCIGETAGRLIRGRGDERDQAAAPAIADHVGHGYRRVADPAGEEFGKE